MFTATISDLGSSRSGFHLFLANLAPVFWPCLVKFKRRCSACGLFMPKSNVTQLVIISVISQVWCTLSTNALNWLDNSRCLQGVHLFFYVIVCVYMCVNVVLFDLLSLKSKLVNGTCKKYCQ